MDELGELSEPVPFPGLDAEIRVWSRAKTKKELVADGLLSEAAVEWGDRPEHLVFYWAMSLSISGPDARYLGACLSLEREPCEEFAEALRRALAKLHALAQSSFAGTYRVLIPWPDSISRVQLTGERVPVMEVVSDSRGAKLMVGLFSETNNLWNASLDAAAVSAAIEAVESLPTRALRLSAVMRSLLA